MLEDLPGMDKALVGFNTQDHKTNSQQHTVYLARSVTLFTEANP